MSDQYGFEMNFGLVQNEDDTYDMGIHITDTDGADINSDVSSVKNIDKGITEILKDASKKIVDQRKKIETAKNDDDAMDIEEYETMIDDLVEQNDALVDEIDKLTDKINKLAHENEVFKKQLGDTVTVKKQESTQKQEPKKNKNDDITSAMASILGLDKREIEMLDKLFSKYL